MNDVDETQIDLSAPLTPSGNLRRRMAVSKFAETITVMAAGLAVAVLAAVVGSVVVHGAAAISWDFITQPPGALGGGGIRPAIVGTIALVALATVIAMPLGIVVAIYLTEFAGPRTGAVIRGALDLLNGLPSIVIGLFIFGLLVVGHGQSGFAGAIALAIIMLPLIARASQEMLSLVPSHLREGADALGVSHWRSVIGVILPAAKGGIVTATVLAIARAAGETAPLLIVDSIYDPGKTSLQLFGHAIPNIPVQIFQLSESSDGLTAAWGAAFVLLFLILMANIGARAMLARSRRKLTR